MKKTGGKTGGVKKTKPGLSGSHRQPAQAGSPVSDTKASGRGPNSNGTSQDSEALLRSFFDSPGVMRGIVEVISDDDVRHITDNAVTASFVGLMPEAMQNRTGSELGEPPEILRLWVDHYRESERIDKPVQFEYLDMRGDKEAWLQVIVSYLDTPPGGFPRFSYIVFDISGEKQAEEALRQSELRYRTVADFTADWEFWFGPDGKFIYVSPSAETILARPIGTFTEIEPFLKKVVHPDDLAGRLSHLKDELSGRESHDIEFRIVRPDGNVRWIHHVCRPVYDAKGVFLGTRGSNRDITERRRIEEALRESEEGHRLLAETMLQGVVHQNADGTIISMNPAAEKILGKTPQEFLGETSESVEHDTIREDGSLFPGIEHPSMVALQTGKQVRGVVMGVFNPRKKEHRWVKIDAVPLFRPGADHPYQVYTVFEDITERKKSAEALQKAHNELEVRVRERTAELNDAVKALGSERSRLYDVLETLPAYVCLLDSDYRMRFANRYFREAFGAQEGRRCYESLFNRSTPCETCETYTVMKTHAPHHWFWTGPNSRDYDIYDHPFTDSDGSFMILEMGIDITERKRAENQWATLASIVEHSNDAIIGKTLTGIITSWNAGAEKMYGYSADEAVGRHISMLMPHGHEDDLNNILERIRKGEPVLHYDAERKRKDGGIIQVSLTISPIKNRDGILIGASTIARDITEQKKAEETIQKANAYNRSLIEASLDPLVTISPDGTISDVNEATIRVTGFSREDLIGTDFSDYFTEPEKAKAGYMRAFRDGSVTDYALEIRHRNGQVTPVLYNATVYRDTAGEVTGVFASARDITEQKKAEETIQKANAYNRSLIEASLDPLVTISPDGTISDVNEATIRVTGFSREDLIGTDFSDYFTEPEKAKAGYMRAFRDGSVTDYALEIRHRNGQVTPVLYNATVYRDTAGKVTGVFASARDITEQKKAEDALQKAHDLLERRVKERTADLVQSNAQLKEEISQRRLAESLVKKTLSELQAAIESTADGIYAVDRAGKIIRYNQNFASMWKVPDELLQSGDDRRISEYLRTQVKNPGLFTGIGDGYGLLKDRESYDMLELRDGRIFERYSKPQKMDGTIIGRVLSYRDVTDRRHAEEKLIASLQEKETLIREIHHRVKNNLQIISGLLDMTRMRTSDSTTNSILTDMMMKIKTMAQIHTRLYESKQFDRINMGSQIRDQVADLSTIYGRSGTEIESEIDAEDIFLPVDQAIPCALVVNEILSNAFKHAFRGRKQGILNISATQSDDHVRIIVRDDGVGISKDMDVYRTTSLGFKLIRSLVQQLNGSVTITSDHGTGITVDFPLHAGGM